MYRRRLQQIFRLARFPVVDYGNEHFVPSGAIVGHLRTLPYSEQWRVSLSERWYHARMDDHSLMVFDDSAGCPSYSFLHCPLTVETIRDFLSRKGLDYSARNIREAQEEYEQVFDTATFRPHVTPIRYDFDTRGYRCGTHPLAHLHIGLDNNVRLALRREMSPVSFSLFVMRQMYPHSWHNLLEHSTNCRLPHVCRAALPLIHDEYWTDFDAIEVHLA
jgi:hypothetical protein